MFTPARRRTNTAVRNDPEGPTLVEALRTARDRHETLLWLGPIALVAATMALATLAGAL